MTDLSALIARLEAAEVGSRELDEAVSTALCDAKYRTCIEGMSDEQGGLWMYEFDGHAPSSALRATQSLDAALALAERVLPRMPWTVSRFHRGSAVEYQAAFWMDPEADPSGKGRAPTPAVALVIAILRAKQGEKT